MVSKIEVQSPYTIQRSTTMSFRFGDATRVLSVLDLHYDIQVENFYFPALAAGAKKRLVKTYPTHADAIRHALSLKSAKHVWAIVLEQDNKPLFVAQNLSCPVREMNFRRVLRIQVDRISPDTSYQARSNHWRVACDPSTSTMM